MERREGKRERGDDPPPGCPWRRSFRFTLGEHEGRVEPVAAPLQPGSPAALRQVMHEPPHLPWEDVEVFERAIAEAKLPVQEQRVFPEDESR